MPGIRGQLDDLRELNPPEDLEDEFTELLDDAEATFEELEQQVEDDPAVLLSDEDPFADINARSTALGLTECGDEEE